MDLIRTPWLLAWRRTYGRARLLFFAQNDFPDVVKDWKEDSSGIITLRWSSVVHSSTSCSILVCHWCFHWTEVASLLTTLLHGRCPQSLHLTVYADTRRTSMLNCLNWVLYGSVENLNCKHIILKCQRHFFSQTTDSSCFITEFILKVATRFPNFHSCFKLRGENKKKQKNILNYYMMWTSYSRFLRLNITARGLAN